MTQERIHEHRPSTRALVVDEALARRLAGFLFADPAPIQDAFVGEPVEVALAMTRWCVVHEGPTFDPARVLVAWAKRRKRGRWSDRPNCAARTIWGEIPAKLNGCSGCSKPTNRRDLIEVVEDHASVTFFAGDEICVECAGNAGIL